MASRPSPGPKLRLEFEDIEEEVAFTSGRWNAYEPAYWGPSPDDAQKLVDFARGIDLDQNGILLVHCYVGISRSVAAAYIIYALHWGEERAREAAQHVYTSQARCQRFGFADPNNRLVHLTSQVVEWDMLSPLEQFDNEWMLSGKWGEFKRRHAKGVSQSGKPR